MEMQKNKSQVPLRTVAELAKSARERAIYEEYQELMSESGHTAMGVNEYLMVKYNVKSIATIYKIRNRLGGRGDKKEE